MPKQTKKHVWIDPNSTALAYLKEKNVSKRQADESRAVSKTPEVLPPAKRAVSQAPHQALPGLPNLELLVEPQSPDLSQMEELIRKASEKLRWDIPEGFLDRYVFERPMHRIRTKAERAELIVALQAMKVKMLEETHNEVEKVRAINKTNLEMFLDAVLKYREIADAQCEGCLVRDRAENQRRIEAAKTEAEIAKHAAEVAECRKRIRDAEREPLPPSPPPPPPPSPEEIREQKKKQIKRELERLAVEEAEDIAKETGGVPEAEWRQEMQEKVLRIKNMYEDRREQKRRELRKYL